MGDEQTPFLRVYQQGGWVTTRFRMHPSTTPAKRITLAEALAEDDRAASERAYQLDCAAAGIKP